ncbi:hypothetical protein ACX1C1_09820 [Paenibacillus sp. strain BS8-2]
MNRVQLQAKVKQLVHGMIHEKREASPLELLLRMDKITPQLVQEWRAGRVPYLERVVRGNLSQLSYIMSIYRKTAKEMGLQESYRSYTRSGKGPSSPLRFSKTGEPAIEKAYSTHYMKKKPVDKPISVTGSESLSLE